MGFRGGDRVHGEVTGAIGSTVLVLGGGRGAQGTRTVGSNSPGTGGRGVLDPRTVTRTEFLKRQSKIDGYMLKI